MGLNWESPLHLKISFAQYLLCYYTVPGWLNSWMRNCRHWGPTVKSCKDFWLEWWWRVVPLTPTLFKSQLYFLMENAVFQETKQDLFFKPANNLVIYVKIRQSILGYQVQTKTNQKCLRQISCFMTTTQQPRGSRAALCPKLHFHFEWGQNHNYMVRQLPAIKAMGQLLAKLILC